MIAVRAPGRVNLIGDHTDYHDGFCLPLAIDRECVVRGEASGNGRVRLRSVQLPGVVDVAADGRDDPATVDPGWGRFVAGVVRELAGHRAAPAGFDGSISSTVPPGSGLSSSTALSVALTLGLAGAAGTTFADRRDAARISLAGEIAATGVPGGIMDQLSSLFGVAGDALLLDCRTLDVTPVPLPHSHAVLVVHSGVPRTLAGSAYAERRAACDAAARRLGIAALRDATPEQVADDPFARHVVSENQRVLDFADALRNQEVNALGPLLLASHASLRDDFAVSTPELDLLVDLLVEHGAIGARLTGAGFGGCVVALVQRNHGDDCAAKTVSVYRERTGLDPEAFVVRAVDGAGRVGEAA